MTAASSIDRKEDVEVSGPERNSGLSEVGANPTQTEEGVRQGGKPEHNHVASIRHRRQPSGAVFSSFNFTVAPGKKHCSTLSTFRLFVIDIVLP